MDGSGSVSAGQTVLVWVDDHPLREGSQPTVELYPDAESAITSALAKLRKRPGKKPIVFYQGELDSMTEITLFDLIHKDLARH